MLKKTNDPTPERHEQFLRLFLPLRNRLHRFACALTRSSEEALDLTGDTILAALEGYDPSRPEESFRSYLFTIAVRIHRRGRKRRERMQRLGETEAENERSSARSPDVQVDIRALQEALTQLPLRQQEAVVLFELSDMSLEEIRKIQGGSLSGVKSRIARGRRRLAELLGAHEETKKMSAPNNIITMEYREERLLTPIVSDNTFAFPLEAQGRKQ